MGERLKTLLLSLLVATSILLTGRLLFGQPALETAAPPAYEQLIFGELKPLSQHILPTLQLGEGDQWRLLAPWDPGYHQAWGALLDLVRYADSPQPSVPSVREPGISAHAVFANPAEPDWWLPSTRAGGLPVLELAWFAAEPQVLWLRGREGAWFSAALTRLPDGWETQLKETFSAAPAMVRTTEADWAPLRVSPVGDILLPAETPVLSPYALRQERLDNEKLIRSIFVNMALVRRIEERDGAVIYTDGQRGLRLFDHGEMEYTSPKSEPGLEPMETAQALKRAAQFLQLMGGWPDDLFIETYATRDRTGPNQRHGDIYTLTYHSVQKGVRVFSPEPALLLRFSDRGVIDYRRHLIRLDTVAGAAEPLVDPRPLAAAVAAALEQNDGEAALEAVYPAYPTTLRGRAIAVSRPVWVFTFDNGQVVLADGYSGELLAP
jgi:hypothetical protein